MAKITYENKEFLNENSQISNINKVTDTDLNEIKAIVNENDDEVGNLSGLNTTDKSSIVNAINEVNSKTYEIIEEETLNTEMQNITISGLDLNTDKHYKIEFYGASNVDGEIQIKLNNITNLYNHIAIAANGTTTTNSNNNLVSAWRNNAEIIAYSMTITDSSAMCILDMELYRNNINETTSYKIDYGYPNAYNHSKVFISGAIDLDTHDNINSITISNSDGTFKVGSKIIVKKIY